MSLPVNDFKRAILAGRQQIGLWVSLANAYCAEIVGGAGFDWLVIDGEHSPNDPPSVLPQLQAVAPYPSEPGGRPAGNDTVLIKRYLDIGARALPIPHRQGAAQAAAPLAPVRHPPH